MKLPVSKSVLRNSLLISSVFFACLLMFNFLFYSLVTYQLTASLDAKIAHEIEHIGYSFLVEDSIFKITHPSEFMERDLVLVDGNSFFLQIYTARGTDLLQSKNLTKFAKIPKSFPVFETQEYYCNTNTANEVVRTGYRKILTKDGELFGYLQLSARRLRLEAALQRIVFYNLLMLPLILIVVFIISIFIARHTLKPINNIINTADRITAHNLNERLQLENDPNDEIERLKATLNHLFERLEVQVQQIATFADNASHQLMSPLTGMIAELDYILKKQTSDVEIKQSIALVRQQSEKMVGIVRSLLLMAKLGGDSFDTRMVFSVESVINKVIRPFFTDGRIKSLCEPDIYIRGRDEYFGIALFNVLDNALKYSGNEHPVECHAEISEDYAIITVKDFGHGIPDKDKQNVFERFFRGNAAEQLGIPGCGLGLSLVHSIITAMNGAISITDTEPSGTTITFRLPRVTLDS